MEGIIVTEFAERLDGVIAQDKVVVEYSTQIKKELESESTSINHNDTLIAGHAILVTDSVREFSRVNALKHENWAIARITS